MSNSLVTILVHRLYISNWKGATDILKNISLAKLVFTRSYYTSLLIIDDLRKEGIYSPLLMYLRTSQNNGNVNELRFKIASCKPVCVDSTQWFEQLTLSINDPDHRQLVKLEQSIWYTIFCEEMNLISR